MIKVLYLPAHRELLLIRAKDARSATVREIIRANLGSEVEVIMTYESAIYPYALDEIESRNLEYKYLTAKVEDAA